MHSYSFLDTILGLARGGKSWVFKVGTNTRKIKRRSQPYQGIPKRYFILLGSLIKNEISRFSHTPVYYKCR